MKCWASVQKLTEVAVEVKTKDLLRQDKLAETQFKADLGSILLENKEAITAADYYLATGIIPDTGVTVLPATPNKP